MKRSLEDAIEQLSKALVEHENSMIKNTELSKLSINQIDYLDTIHHNEGLTYGQLSTLLKLSKPSVTAIVDKFLEKDYVKRVQSDEDKRVYKIYLTKKGKELAYHHDKISIDFSKFFVKALNKDELETVTELLNKVLDII